MKKIILILVCISFTYMACSEEDEPEVNKIIKRYDKRIEQLTKIKDSIKKTDMPFLEKRQEVLLLTRRIERLKSSKSVYESNNNIQVYNREFWAIIFFIAFVSGLSFWTIYNTFISKKKKL